MVEFLYKIYIFVIIIMRIELNKFGKILTSRQDGREAYSAISAKTNKVLKNEDIELDFLGVKVLSPGWADEVITKIVRDFKSIILINTDNPSVKATLNFLKDINGYKLNIK